MLLDGEFVSVHWTAGPRAHQVRRIDINERVRIQRRSSGRLGTVLSQAEVDAKPQDAVGQVQFDVSSVGQVLGPPIKRLGIRVNQNRSLGWSLELCDRIVAGACCDVGPMWWYLVDQSLVDAWSGFSAWVWHGLVLPSGMVADSAVACKACAPENARLKMRAVKLFS